MGLKANPLAMPPAIEGLLMWPCSGPRCEAEPGQERGLVGGSVIASNAELLTSTIDPRMVFDANSDMYSRLQTDRKGCPIN